MDNRQHPTERTAIRNLQRYLHQLSYEDKDIPPVPVDGIFDNVTRNALIVFQKKKGLEPTGVADKITWDLLYLSYLDSIGRFSPPEAIELFPRNPENYKLGPGDSYFLVNVIQYMLREVSRDYGDELIINITGEYDVPTEKAIMSFQAKNQLPQTGLVDLATWNALVKYHNNISHEYVQ